MRIGQCFCVRLNTTICNLIGKWRYMHLDSDFELYVKGNRIPMNDFVANVISGVLMAILSNLRDIDLDKISLVEIQ